MFAVSTRPSRTVTRRRAAAVVGTTPAAVARPLTVRPPTSRATCPRPRAAASWPRRRPAPRLTRPWPAMTAACLTRLCCSAVSCRWTSDDGTRWTTTTQPAASRRRQAALHPARPSPVIPTATSSDSILKTVSKYVR